MTGLSEAYKIPEVRNKIAYAFWGGRKQRYHCFQWGHLNKNSNQQPKSLRTHPNW